MTPQSVLAPALLGLALGPQVSTELILHFLAAVIPSPRRTASLHSFPVASISPIAHRTRNS